MLHPVSIHKQGQALSLKKIIKINPLIIPIHVQSAPDSPERYLAKINWIADQLFLVIADYPEDIEVR